MCLASSLKMFFVGGKLQGTVEKQGSRAGRWWLTPLIPALGRQRQADLCEFEAWSTRASSGTGTKKAMEKPCLEKIQKKKRKKKTKQYKTYMKKKHYKGI